MRCDDFTIIVQGKLHSRSIENLSNYDKFSNIIISCWEDDDITLLSKVNRPYILIKNKLMKDRLLYNKGHIDKQVITTLNGLNICRTIYSIKVRSDEKYSNLDPIINKILQNSEKVISSTIYFCNRPYHPSDHIIAGKTSILLKNFQFALRMCIGELPNPFLSLLAPENLICLSLMMSKNIKPNLEDWVLHMKQNYDIVPMKELGDIIWVSNMMGIISNKDNFNDYNLPCKTIFSMDELSENI